MKAVGGISPHYSCTCYCSHFLQIVVVTGREYAEHFWREAKALRGEEGGAEARITVTSFTWVLDCVVNFSVMPFVAVT